jgi:hypothetical protein
MSKDRKKFTAAKRGTRPEPILEVKEEQPAEQKLVKVEPPPSFKQIWHEYATAQQKVEYERVSEFCNLTTLIWVGFKKDSGNGKIWGIFSEKEQKIDHLRYIYDGAIKPAFVFSGKIGSTVTIAEIPGNRVSDEIRAKRANYVTIEPNKMIRVITSWPQFNSEVGMFLTYRKLAGK